MKKTAIILLFIFAFAGLNYADEKTDAVLKKAAEYQQAGEHEKAIAEARKIFGMTDDKKAIADACWTMGNSEFSLARYVQALENYMKSAEYYRDDVMLMENIILCYYNLKDYAKLESYGLSKIKEFPDNLKVKAKVYYYFLGLKINADKYLDEAVRVEAMLPEGDGDLCYNIACIYSLNKDTEKAVKYLDKSIYYCNDDVDKLTRQIDWMQQDADMDNIRSAEYYKNLIAHREDLINGIKAFYAAHEYDNNHKFNEAIDNYLKAIGLFGISTGDKSLWLATSCNNLGSTYDSKGDYDRAIDFYEKSLAIRLEVLGEKHQSTATSYNNLGLAYANKGDYDRAIAYYEKTLAIRLEVLGEKHSDTADSYHNLGGVYCDKGDYDRAIEYHEKALAIRLEILGEKNSDTVSSYNGIGYLYFFKGDYDRAIAYFEKALVIYLEIIGETDLNVAIYYNNLGASYDNKGDHDRAIEYYEKSLTIRTKILGENHYYIAESYNNLGLVYNYKGDYDHALEYYEKAMVILKENESYQQTVTGSQNIGFTYNKIKQYSKAYTSFLTGIETIEKVRRLNISGGTDFTSRNIDSYYYAANACFLDKNMENMFNISERMRAMGYLERLSLKGAIDAAGIDPEKGKRLLKLKDDIERLSSLRQKLISRPVSSMNEQQKKERDKQLEDTSKQLVAAENEFNKLDSEFMKNEKYKMLRDSTVVSVKTAQGLCAKDGAIIEFIIPEKPDDYMKPYAIIITAGSINAVELDSSYNYSGSVDKYRKAVKENNQPEINSTGAELYSKLIAPVNSFINSNSIKKLIIVPDGSLAFLPFDSLKTEDNRYLSERYELNLTPSVTVSCMIKNRKYDKRDNLMAFGGGKYSSTGESKTRGESSFRGIVVEEKEKEKLAVKAYNSPLEYYNAQRLGWADLPGTEREVSAINEKIYKKKNTDVYKGESVSEENLKSLSKSGRLKKYSSIHLACHGYYDPEYPAYSAVVFSEVSGKVKESRDDGYMSVEETALLNLQSEIVVLSACETGLGRMVSGDGVIGLTRAFQVAGSNRVLVTLWPVNDEATEAFMVSFYAKVRAGMGYSEALVKVKEEFRRSVEYSAPYYWAGFVLYE